jgi:hypothetical protein
MAAVNTPMIIKPGFGRLRSVDFRDHAYAIRALEPPIPPPVGRKQWNEPPVMDQGQSSQCVAYSGTAWLAAGPVTNKQAATPWVTPDALYHLCQQNDEWPGECVDMNTFCLSERGWLTGDELREGDRILTFEMERETTRWAEVQAVHRYPAKKYRVWSHAGFSAAVTDNHRWPVRCRPNGIETPKPFRFTTTADWGNGDEFLRAAPCDQLPGEARVDNDFVELVAWVAAEGHYRPEHRRGNGIVVSQKTEKIRVAELMERFSVSPGYEKSDGCHVWEISGDLAARIREIAPDRAPSIRFLMGLTQAQLELFLEVFVLADGNEATCEGREPRISFSQKTGPILDSVLAAASLAGVAVSRSNNQFCDVEIWTLRRSNRVEVRRLKPSEYETGRVWCPQTSMGTFVARRGASIFITGNSYDGTSVRGLFKVLQANGFIGSYLWAFDANAVAHWILTRGPVVIGSDWAESMMETEPGGWCRLHPELNPTIAGGHAYLLIGTDAARKAPDGTVGAVRLQNSWGRGWGENGRAWMSYADLDILIKSGGEACTATEIKFKPQPAGATPWPELPA